MRVFAYEHFSGGGLAGLPLPPSLAREGDLMLACLAGELAELPDVEVVATRDPRLPPLARCTTRYPDPGEPPAGLFARGLAVADMAWPTAPEGGGVLEHLAAATLAADRLLLGCRPEAVRIAASKHATARALAAAGIPVVPTWRLGDPMEERPGPWVVKPDDGAGCEGLELVPDREAALARLDADPELVAQPWIEGEALSLSLLYGASGVLLLSCNRQVVGVHPDRVELDAVLVNDLIDRGGRFARLAHLVGSAIPGLWGYVGADLVLGPDGPVVLEVNPRLTTSYCGLRAALGCNTAAMVLELARQGRVPPALLPRGGGTTAEVRLEPSRAA
jgi:predicted ATP-grasp superfamily ATP-dependent carboligase